MGQGCYYETVMIIAFSTGNKLSVICKNLTKHYY